MLFLSHWIHLTGCLLVLFFFFFCFASFQLLNRKTALEKKQSFLSFEFHTAREPLLSVRRYSLPWTASCFCSSIIMRAPLPSIGVNACFAPFSFYSLNLELLLFSSRQSTAFVWVTDCAKFCPDKSRRVIWFPDFQWCICQYMRRQKNVNDGSLSVLCSQFRLVYFWASPYLCFFVRWGLL